MTITITHPFISVVPDDPTVIAAGGVTPSKWNASHTVVGAVNSTFGFDGSGNSIELTNTTLTARINTFSSTLSGAAPASGGGTVNFLRADGTWAVTSAAPGGSNGQLLWNNSGVSAGVSGSTVDTNGSITLGGATVTTSDPVLNLSQTWNSGGVVFTSVKSNVTNTASAIGSLLYDWQLGGNSVSNLDKSGQQTLFGNLRVGTNNTVTFTSSTFLGQFISPNGSPSMLEMGQNSVAGWRFGMQPAQVTFRFDDSSDTLLNPSIDIIGFNNGGSAGHQGLNIHPTGFLGWPSSVGSAADTALYRVTSGVVGIGTGAASPAGWFNYAGTTHITSDFPVSNSTPVNVAGLSVNLAAGRSYAFDVYLNCTDAAAGGVQALIGGTAGCSAFVADGWVIENNAIKIQGTTITIGNPLISTTTTATSGIVIEIRGTCTVGVSGTLTVQFAQSSNNGTASIVKAGSRMIVQDIP